MCVFFEAAPPSLLLSPMGSHIILRVIQTICVLLCFFVLCVYHFHAILYARTYVYICFKELFFEAVCFVVLGLFVLCLVLLCFVLLFLCVRDKITFSNCAGLNKT